MSSSVSGVGQGDAIASQYDVDVTRAALDQQKQDGQGALQLIDSARPEPAVPSPDGKGVHVNTYA
jgi:hypothetical protein